MQNNSNLPEKFLKNYNERCTQDTLTDKQKARYTTQKNLIDFSHSRRAFTYDRIAYDRTVHTHGMIGLTHDRIELD